MLAVTDVVCVDVFSVIVIVTVVEFGLALASLATTVMAFAPLVRVSDPLQLAVPVPAAVSPFARTPLIVTDKIPLSPRPASVAVPEIVMELEETV